MNRPARYPAGFSKTFRRELVAVLLLALSVPAARAQGTSTLLAFADNRIAVEILSPQGPVPERVLSVLPMAMKSALEQIGAPEDPVRLTIRLQAPPPFHRRALAWFRVEPSAIQQGDDILLQAGDDPLILAFRLGHELSHWLVSKRHPVRPPLWLDEGLAQMVAADTASVCARTLKQNLERPRPAHLARSRFRLDELTALRAYPKTEARSAAFYWQAEALVRAIHQRLGPADFAAYLGLLCSPDPPPWPAPLRERWYFSDWDMNWLEEQVRPGPKVNK